MKYRSKPTEIEAMQWTGDEVHAPNLHTIAQMIVAWVNTNGGEARYEPRVDMTANERYHAAIPDHRIAVRTINGWAYAAPGHYVVMGSSEFQLRTSDPKWYRDFYPCDPETFEQRWEPQPTEGSEQ